MEQTPNTGWRDALDALHQWADAQEGICLTPTRTSVPKPLRAEFYRRVEEVQALLAAQLLQRDLASAEVLAGRVRLVRVGLCRSAGLARYGLAPRLEQFLDDPRGAVARPLQSLVLDALGGAADPEQVEAEASRQLRPALDALLRAAYEAWTYLGVMAALRPVRIRAVAPAENDGAAPVPGDEVRAGWQVPSRELCLPEAVLTCEDGTAFAVKMECAREIDYYDALTPVARDTSAGGSTHELLAHRVLLVYRLPREEAVAPVVNRKQKRQTPCDLAVTVLAPREMENPSYLGSFMARARKLRTKRPLQVLTYGEAAFPAAMADDPDAPAVRLHRTGLDEDALAQVVAQLSTDPVILPVIRPM